MTKLKYYHNLDGMRAIAALMVIVFHFMYSTLPNSIHIDLLKKITLFGEHGVSLFFVLSGFVISRILINTKGNESYFSSFYKKRLLRIFPLYYFYLILINFIFPFLSTLKLSSFSFSWPYYLFLQNIINSNVSGPGHYWSLAVEEHFYLLWPIIIYFTPVKHLFKTIILGVVFVFFIKFFILKNGLSINYFTLIRIDQLMFGALLALLEKNNFFEKYK